MHYQDDSGNFIADKDIKDSFTKLGFRWKIMNNDPESGKRIEILGLKRPEI